MPAKVHLRLRFQNLGKPRTAGLCGRVARMSDCGPLSVLKSNGLRHLKNLPVKFGFSLKTVPANTAQKLPSQRCPQPFLITIFNFSHKWPTLAFTPKIEYTLACVQRVAHSGSHAEIGIPRPQRVLVLPAKSPPKEQPKEADARLMACVRFLRHRGPAGLRDLFSLLSKLRFSHSVLRAFRVCETWEVSLPSACFACF